MKTVILALLVLLVVSQGEALRCYCGGTSKRCSSRVETCSGSNPVCASITLTAGPIVSYFQSCYRESDCRSLLRQSYASGRCCKSDLCN
ncbi:CD59 glycoprotein-like [Centropristis striata]|uniref:CD59 glycoprotein-like n=1 Tax=Centropristis striata TaxID=184440 RepID=UPI0027DF9A7C|nr:CD59 glycoprotein-like [Centropristis striata]